MAKDKKHKIEKKAPVNVHKAKEILHHGEVHGKKLTGAQTRFFGLIAGGGKPTKNYG